jgi:hypothetical protein
MTYYNTAYANPYSTSYSPYAYVQPQPPNQSPYVVNYNYTRTQTTNNNIYNYDGTVYNNGTNYNNRPPYSYYPQSRQNTTYAYAPSSLFNFATPSWGTSNNSSKGGTTYRAGFGDLASDPRFASVYDRPAPEKRQQIVTPIAPLAPRKLIAANEHSSYWGDPHVADADRSDKGNKRQDNFVVKGDGVFNLLTDKNISLNAQHKKYDQWGIEVTDQIGLRIPNSNINITFSAYGTPQLNGKALETGEKKLPDQTKISWNGTTLSVTSGDSGEYNVSVAIVTTEHKNADGSPVKYLDTDLSTKGNGVGNDGVMPSGILGEGFDDDGEARTALKKDLSTYKRNGLLD